MQKQQNQLKGALTLIIAAFIWGTAFVAQSVGMEFIGPFTFVAARSYIGAAFLSIIIFISYILKKRNPQAEEKNKAERKKMSKTLLIGGAVCGTILCLASSIQQIGLQYTTVGKAGFLTALYIVIVPILGLFFGKKLNVKIILSVIIALVGTYFLSIKDGFSISSGDLLVIICAFLFSAHIIAIDHFAPKADGIKLSCTQFIMCAIISTIVALIFENPQFSAIFLAILPLLYTGVMSSGVAYTLQIMAQRRLNPAVACIIMSVESVFAAGAGWLILGQQLSTREILGCVLVFIAVIIAQIPKKDTSKL